MKTMQTKGLMLATGLATLAMMQPAMALDADAFIDRIETVYQANGYEFSFGPASVQGSDVIVEGVRIGIAGVDEEPTQFDITLTFTDVEEYEDGSFTARELRIPDIDTEFASDPVGHVSLTGMVAQDIWLPPEGDTSAESLMQTVARVATGPLVVSRDGAEIIRIESMEMLSDFSYAADESLESVRSDVSIANIWADLSIIGEDEPETAAIIEALGLDTVSGNITQSMSWTMEDGHLAIEQLLLDFADIGALDFTFEVTGFTMDVLDKVYAMQALDLESTSEEAQARQMMTGMEIAQALSIVSASVRYDDAGLAGNLLDMFAAQSGVGRAQFVEVIKPMVPAMIGQAGVPALTELVVPQVNAFLDDPQSFEIAVAPPSPTSFLVLAAAAANPAGLITALGLTVAANQ